MDLPCNLINPLSPSCQSAELWNYKRDEILQIAKETTPNNTINTMYHHDLDITHIYSWRIVSDRKKGTGMTKCLFSRNSTSLCAHVYRKVGDPRLQEGWFYA